MIKQFSAHHIKTLKKIGSIEFRVDAAFAMIAATDRFLNILHRVVYVQRDEEPQHLFDCNMSTLNQILTANDIARPKGGTISLTKEQEYLLLGLTVDAAESLAISQGKRKLIVTSNVPYIANILVERDFVTKERKTHVGGYKGIKSLNTVSGKDKDESNHSNAEGKA